MLAKIMNAIGTALIVVVAACAVALLGGRLFGFYPYAILSGSMEPAYSVGDLIVVQRTDASDLEVGDVVTFMASQDTTVTHRIDAIVPDATDPTLQRFQTKGDANDAVDGTLVHPNNVVGTPVLTVPYVGYISKYLQAANPLYLAFCLICLVLFFMVLPHVFAKDDDEEDEEGEGDLSEKEGFDASESQLKSESAVEPEHEPKIAVGLKPEPKLEVAIESKPEPDPTTAIESNRDIEGAIESNPSVEAESVAESPRIAKTPKHARVASTADTPDATKSPTRKTPSRGRHVGVDRTAGK